jgi:hypothetical protein
VPVFPFSSYSRADARSFARSLGSVDDPGATSCVVLLGSLPDGGELLLRADDEVIEHLDPVLDGHACPFFVVSNRRAGSEVAAPDRQRWDEARRIADQHGAMLLDWLVVDGEEVTSLAPNDVAWTIRCGDARNGRNGRHPRPARPGRAS